MIKLPPLSLYVHLPWCVRKCPYCDFNSHRMPADLQREPYVDALLADFRREVALKRTEGRPVGTVFLGGGTPSLFAPREIRRLVRGIAGLSTLAPDAEITMEANPGTIEYADPAGYREAGVNRLSLGAQSFDADALRRLGRIHGPDEIHQAFQAARRAGFDNINLDLMFALPGQDLDAAMRDLAEAIALSPEHVSWYQLTLEPNTVFHERPPADLPDEDAAWCIQAAGHALLEGAGYRQYEVSAFSRPGLECRHNLNYWHFGDYLAIGAGAHGKYTDQAGNIWRYRKPANPRSYLQAVAGGSPDEALRSQGGPDACFEFMLNGLRLSRGITEAAFLERTGQPLAAIVGTLQGAMRDGLLQNDSAGHWRPTALGRRFLNDLQARFLP